jgi:hypothetical protein
MIIKQLFNSEKRSRKMNRGKWLKRVIGFALISLILVGCGGAAVEPTVTPTIQPSPTPTIPPSPTPTVPPTPTPLSPEEILEFGGAATEELDSYHFTMVINMTTKAGGTPMETPIIFTGDFKAPDRFQGELKMELGELSIETEVIMIGESFYIRDPTSGEWQLSAEPATPFLPDDFVGLESINIPNMVNLTLLRETVLDGVPVYLVEGMLPPEVMDAVLGEAGGKNKVVYWIGVEDGWIRRVNIDAEFLLEDVEIHTTIIMNLSEFNKEIVIEAP